MKNLRKNNNAITLIALVITIVILLILAGLTIMGLSGENGLFFRTKQAKENMEEAQNLENKILDEYQSKINQYMGNENKNNDNSEGEYVEFAASNSNIINVEQSVFQSVNGITLNKGETKKIEIPDKLTDTQLIIQLKIKYGRDTNSVAIYFYNDNNERILDTGTHFEYAGGTTEEITKEYTIPQNCKYIEFWVGDGPYEPYMIINNIGIVYSALSISGEVIGSNQTLTLRGLNHLSYCNIKIDNKTKGTTKILYKIDEGEWKEYNGGILKIEKKCTIYVRGYNESGELGITEETFEIEYKGLTNNSFDSDDTTYDSITINSPKLIISPEIYGKTMEIKLKAKYGRDTNSVAIYFYDENNEKIPDLGTHFEYAGGTTEEITKEYTILQNCKYIEFWVGDGPYNPYMYIYEISIK